MPFWQSRDWGPADWLMHEWGREVARENFIAQVWSSPFGPDLSPAKILQSPAGTARPSESSPG